MLNYLKGTVLLKKERYIILTIDENTGYRLYITNQLLESLSLGETIALFVYTQVREDTIELFGFASVEELDFFERLISISGVGPKIALGVLSVAPLPDIKKAIIHGDPELLQKVASVGKKTAERIIVELKEKITVSEKDITSGMSISENIQLLEALSSLGYRDNEIRKAMRQIPAETKELSDKIKEALKILSTRA